MNKGLSRRRIVLNGQDIEYELQRKQVKNINLRIRQDGTVLSRRTAGYMSR